MIIFKNAIFFTGNALPPTESKDAQAVGLDLCLAPLISNCMRGTQQELNEDPLINGT